MYEVSEFVGRYARDSRSSVSSNAVSVGFSFNTWPFGDSPESQMPCGSQEAQLYSAEPLLVIHFLPNDLHLTQVTSLLNSAGAHETLRQYFQKSTPCPVLVKPNLHIKHQRNHYAG